MATIRIPEAIWQATHAHLFTDFREHFAFFLARWTYTDHEPIFLVSEVLLVPDDQLTGDWNGMELGLDGILAAINFATKSGDCLIEIHNHGGSMPRFSHTDRQGLREFPLYVHESLPGRPYAATVWGDSTIYGEFFLPNGHNGLIDSITVIGKHLRQVVSMDTDYDAILPTYARQLPWFTEDGQRQLARLRVGVIGCGGIGSQVIQNLAYLGCQDFVLVDDDQVDETNMNRLITATSADIGASKVLLGQRLVKTVSQLANVLSLEINLQNPEALAALRNVDVLFGCVDNDGARLILNELALAYCIPYVDIAVGIEAENGNVSVIGGRVAVVLPDGPCLNCMHEINQKEAAYILASPAERAENVARGYVTGMNVQAPAVVSLNALLAAAAVNEFATLVSGMRPINPYTEYDLLGTGRSLHSQWLVPTKYKRDAACVEHIIAGQGDQVDLERFVQTNDVQS